MLKGVSRFQVCVRVQVCVLMCVSRYSKVCKCVFVKFSSVVRLLVTLRCVLASGVCFSWSFVIFKTVLGKISDVLMALYRFVLT